MALMLSFANTPDRSATQASPEILRVRQSMLRYFWMVNLP